MPHTPHPGLPASGGAWQTQPPLVFLERVYLDRTDRGRKSRFPKVKPRSDADIAAVLQQIGRRIIRTLRWLEYLETGIDDAVATDYDPLRDDEP
ncbi:MAG TPA: hypothetical protein VIH59_30295, partial [Candidatus Tectomicrobia bacterium]